MFKNITKTESTAEFLARGGVIKKVSAKSLAKRQPKAMHDVEQDEADMYEIVDYGALPAALKIRYGMR